MSTLEPSESTPPTRPNGRVAEPRTHRLDIRVTPSELDQIRTRAGGPRRVSEFVRRAALGRRLPTSIPAPTADAVNELRRVGSNLNQVARHLNTTNMLGPAESTELRRLLAEVSTTLVELGASLTTPMDGP